MAYSLVSQFSKFLEYFNCHIIDKESRILWNSKKLDVINTMMNEILMKVRGYSFLRIYNYLIHPDIFDCNRLSTACILEMQNIEPTLSDEILKITEHYTSDKYLYDEMMKD